MSNVTFPFGPVRFEERRCRFHRKHVEISERTSPDASITGVIIFLDQTRCGRLRIICGEDSNSSPHIPGQRIILESSDEALEPDVRISRTGKPVKRHQDYIRQLDWAS